MEIFGMEIPDKRGSLAAQVEAPFRQSSGFPPHEVYRIAIARQITWLTPVVEAAFERAEWANDPNVEQTVDAALQLVRARARTMATVARLDIPPEDMVKAFLPVASRMVASLIRQASTIPQFHMWLQRIEAHEKNNIPLRLLGLGQVIAKCAELYPAPKPGPGSGMAVAVPTLIAEMLGPDVIAKESAFQAALPIIERFVGEVVDLSVRQAAEIRHHTPDDAQYTVPSVFAMCGKIMISLATAMFKVADGQKPPETAVESVVEDFRRRATIACSVLARRVEHYVSNRTATYHQDRDVAPIMSSAGSAEPASPPISPAHRPDVVKPTAGISAPQSGNAKQRGRNVFW